jgi:hypothetical protein
MIQTNMVQVTLLYFITGGRRSYVTGETPVGNDYFPTHHTSAELAKHFPDESTASVYMVRMKNPEHKRYLVEQVMIQADKVEPYKIPGK